jgi:serine/threonine protein kinase
MMSVANWTTRLMVVSAQDGGNQPDRPARGPADAASEGSPELRVVPRTLVGTQVGAYLITKRLGAGGVGEVFKGVDVMLKREVAIKVLRDELASDPTFLERFRQEAQLHAKLSHPNVASVHAFLHEGDTQFMVMEYVPGISLDEFVRSGGPVPIERALTIFRRALDGIEHAHRCGIVHRDIKPANIMLADSGQVKVMDFGIARALDNQEHLTRHGHVAGTAKAMSPEQIRGKQADVRSDVYSLGLVLYTLLAGCPPFDAKDDLELMKCQVEQAPPPLHELVDRLPTKVEAAVMRALEKDPSARFQTVREFARAIDACLADLAAPPALPERLDDVHASSRTVVNPVLQGAQRLPGTAAAGSERGQDKPWRRLPGLNRRVGLIALALVALVTGAALLWPRLSPLATPAAAPQEPIVVAAPPRPAPPVEPVVAAALPVPSVPETTPAPLPQPASPPPVVETVTPRRLTIERLPSEDRADATAPGDAGATYRFKPGERIRLMVTTSQDAHVYCYLQDEARRIVRFYPNRFSKSALVRADSPLRIPGQMGFELVANDLKVTETLACFASDRDVISELPAAVVGTDFAKLPVSSLDEVKSAFASVAADSLAQASFRVEPR